MKTYVKQFHNLNCSQDILEILGNINNLNKEISESMAIIKQLKKIVFKNPNKYVLYDLCAGNALTSVIAAYLLPFKKVIAVDIKKRKEDYSKIRNFEYRQGDIFEPLIDDEKENMIVISVHPCQKTAVQILQICANDGNNIAHSIIMPCCSSENSKSFRKKIPNWIIEKLNCYEEWVLNLQMLDDFESKVVFDKNCMSPKNAIIIKNYKEKISKRCKRCQYGRIYDCLFLYSGTDLCHHSYYRELDKNFILRG